MSAGKALVTAMLLEPPTIKLGAAYIYQEEENMMFKASFQEEKCFFFLFFFWQKSKD